MFSLFAKSIVVLFFLTRYGYWIITERKAEINKPKRTMTLSWKFILRKSAFLFIDFLILLQFLGLELLPLEESVHFLQALGSLVSGVGLVICLWARKVLGDNWTYASEYQIKPRHELVKNGIYAYLRHPIYFGSVLMLVGAEMVAGSLLFILFFGLFIVFYFRCKREEHMLEAHFGEEFRQYKKQSKMMIPFVF